MTGVTRPSFRANIRLEGEDSLGPGPSLTVSGRYGFSLSPALTLSTAWCSQWRAEARSLAKEAEGLDKAFHNEVQGRK